jgi:ankyrin repeat protein
LIGAENETKKKKEKKKKRKKKKTKEKKYLGEVEEAGAGPVEFVGYDALTSLQIAGLMAHREVVELLLAAGADKDRTEHGGFTALLMAAQHGHEDVVKLLLEAGKGPKRGVWPS